MAELTAGVCAHILMKQFEIQKQGIGEHCTLIIYCGDILNFQAYTQISSLLLLLYIQQSLQEICAATNSLFFMNHILRNINELLVSSFKMEIDLYLWERILDLRQDVPVHVSFSQKQGFRCTFVFYVFIFLNNFLLVIKFQIPI